MSLIGQTIGRIQIIDELARGGFGELYLGFDSKLQRRVAVKALRSKYRLDEATKARFLREARVLSQLNHVNICQIHDYIETETLDILVLELIEGRDLERAVSKGLDEAQKFHIAEDLASALAVAHEQEIIHRDLKPGNIMITPEGVVKVLDFGLARKVVDTEASTIPASGVLGEEGSEDDLQTEAMQTRLGAVLGTVGYMSPEQAKGENVTTASDVYSLGLVLQHLFTGRRPYEENLPRVDQLERAAAGQTEPVEGLDDDLTDLIERLKALYPGVRPSARDVEYRLRWIRGKAPRRLRRRLRIAAFGVLLLILAVVGYQAFRISREAERANREARTAEQVSEFLVDLFEVSDPSERLGGTITVREVLNRGAKRATVELESEPLVKARLLTTIGTVYGNLGLYDHARVVLAQALESRRREFGGDHLDVADSHCWLGYILRLLGEFEGSEQHYQDCIRVRTLHLGEDSGPVADSIEELAMVFLQRGELDEAYGLQQRALEIRRALPDEAHPQVASSLAGLSGILMEMAEVTGDSSYADEGLTVSREALRVARRTFGDQHPDATGHMSNLAFWLARAGEIEEAEALYREALEISRRVLGKDHPGVATTMSNLSILLSGKGAYSEAGEFARAALEVRRSYLPADHWRIAQAESVLGASLVGTGHFEEAEKLLLKGYGSLMEQIGATAILTKEAQARIVDLYTAWGKLEDAQTYQLTKERDVDTNRPEV